MNVISDEKRDELSIRKLLKSKRIKDESNDFRKTMKTMLYWVQWQFLATLMVAIILLCLLLLGISYYFFVIK